MLYLQRDLDCDKFAKLASIALQSNTPYIKADVLDVCENLVKAPAADFVQFVHLSVHEFLEALEDRSVVHFRREEGSAGVAVACLRNMAGAFDKPLTPKEVDIMDRTWSVALKSYEITWENRI